MVFFKNPAKIIEPTPRSSKFDLLLVASLVSKMSFEFTDLSVNKVVTQVLVKLSEINSPTLSHCLLSGRGEGGTNPQKLYL